MGNQPPSPEELEELFGSFSDLFGQMPGGPKRTGPRRGADLQLELTLTLEEALLGGERTVPFPRPLRCARCAGEGREPGSEVETCGACEGKGTKAFEKGAFRIAQTCAECTGTGKRILSPCVACEGQGTKAQPTKLKVKVPEGVKEGQRLRLRGMGAESRAGGAAGDLYIELKILDHPGLRRRGDDLIAEVAIEPSLAEEGGSLEVPGPIGAITVQVPAGTASGDEIVRRGAGLPRAEEEPFEDGAGTRESPYRHTDQAATYGDLIVRLLIRDPGARAPGEKASPRGPAPAPRGDNVAWHWVVALIIAIVGAWLLLR